MKKLIPVLFISLTANLHAQTVSAYFEKIRNDASALTAFFQQMPKGGDLHHHYSGSVYTETFIDAVVANDYFINKTTLEVLRQMPSDNNGEWANFSTLKKEGSLDVYKQKLIQQWSAKDYNYIDYPSHLQFFESFGHFEVAEAPSLKKGLMELKARAKAEHLSYIETSLETIRCSVNTSDLNFADETLRSYENKKNEIQTSRLLDSLYSVIQARNVSACAISFNHDFIEKLHTDLQIDDSDFTMRYQTFVLRVLNPVEVFKNLVIAFESANASPLIVGVNIVAPEDNEISMEDYWLHMQMFKYCHSKFPNVKYSMHAGELTLGLVKPEELTWHINAAVYEAKANRIGHGVDMPYEKDCYSLLNYMAKNDIPVEINLYSNEFILKVKEDRHPVMLYKNAHVPIVISTDDAGILRTNITEQYVLLAKRYKQISYTDIKKFVYNSIQYSFIKEPALKQKLTSRLDADFKAFEKRILLISVKQ